MFLQLSPIIIYPMSGPKTITYCFTDGSVVFIPGTDAVTRFSTSVLFFL